jgi:hypothetical protein
MGRKSAMTLTIELTPTEEARLDAVAAQKGWNRTEAAYRVLTENLPSMVALTPSAPTQNYVHQTRLVEEYHALLDQEDRGALSAAQIIRLRQVQEELDRLEDQDPIEQAADRRLQETGDKLDEILALLRSLPKKKSAS